jgi:hemolysin D
VSTAVEPARDSAPLQDAEKTSAKARMRAILRRDREFLPAALEILETPPAPAAIALLLAICSFMSAALAWSFIGRLDVNAIATGKLEVAGRVKVIQPLEPGKVREIAVDNGAAVKAGDLLVALDPSEPQADERNYSEALSASEAEATRRRAAIAVARNAQDAKDLETPDLSWSDSVPEPTRFREEAVLRADLNQLADTLNDLDQQIAQKSATIDKLNLSIAYQNKLIATLTDRVDLRSVGIKLNIDTKVNLFDAQESLEKSQSALASDQGQLVETNAAIKELASQKRKVISQFVADNETKCADAERKAQDVAQQLAKAQSQAGPNSIVRAC